MYDSPTLRYGNALGIREERPEVLASQLRSVLSDSEAYHLLPRREKEAIARDLGQVLDYLAQPLDGDVGVTGPPPEHQPVAEDTTLASSNDPQEAGRVLKDFADKVDFPAFVAGLIKGVFAAIVQSSIKQMKAYQELLSSVVKSTEDFASSEIPDHDAQNNLLSTFGGLLSNQNGKLVQAQGADKDRLDAKLASMGIDSDLSSAANQQKLINTAKVDLARQKQKLLATLVLMGIDRIIVTDGTINATVAFDVTGSSAGKRVRSRDQQQTNMSVASASGTGGAGPGGIDSGTADGTGPDSASLTNMVNQAMGQGTGAVHLGVSTPSRKQNQTDDDSVTAMGKLHGKVSVSFKSQTFPLDRFDPAALTQIQGVASRPVPGQNAPAAPGSGAPGATPGAAAPPAPPQTT